MEELKWKKQKVQLELSKTGLNQLIWIQEELNVKSLADVMRSGLKLINYALKMRNEGWKLILEKDGKFKEIYFK